MKCKKFLVSIIMALLVVLMGSYCAFAVTTGFETDELSLDENAELLSRFDIKKTSEFIQKDNAKYFDVNKNGWIALGLDNVKKKTVYVYDDKMSFQYGCTFDSLGSYGVELSDENNIILSFVREDLAVELDKDCNCIGIASIKDTEYNNSYLHHTVHAPSREVNGYTYKLKNEGVLLNILPTSFSKFVRIDKNGNEEIIYDSSDVATKGKLIFTIAMVIGISFAIITVIKSFPKKVR